MLIEVGTMYEISNQIKGYYNSAETMTVIRLNGGTVQFKLENGKGHGSMPLQHFHYLLKRSELSLLSLEDKKRLLQTEETEQHIS